MRHSINKIFLVGTVLMATTTWADAGPFDGLGSLGGAIGLGSGGGASFSATGAQMQSQLLVGLRSLVTAVSLMQEASGHKQQADKLKAVSDELQRTTTVSSAQVEQTVQAFDDNPVDRSQLANVHDAKSKQLLVQSAGNMAIAGLWNAKAVSSAQQLASIRPGLGDAMAAPALLNTAKVVVTTLPAEIGHTATYTSMLADYMRDNKLSPPSKDDQRKLAVAQGADPAQVAANLP